MTPDTNPIIVTKRTRPILDTDSAIVAPKMPCATTSMDVLGLTNLKAKHEVYDTPGGILLGELAVGGTLAPTLRHGGVEMGAHSSRDETVAWIGRLVGPFGHSMRAQSPTIRCVSL